MSPKSVTKSPVLLAILVFCVALIAYTATLAPGLLWGGGDFATFQTRAYLIEIEPGVFGHPLWVILTHPFTRIPIRDVAWRANFAAATYGALALVFVFLISRELTGSAKASLLGTGALMVSHTFWTYSVMPKVYSLNALLLVACIYLIIRWGRCKRGEYLYAFALLYGLSQLNHLVMATAAVGFGLYIGLTVRRHRDAAVWRQLIVAAVFFLGGLAPYLLLALGAGAAQSTGGTIMRFLRGTLYVLTAPRGLLLGLGFGLALLVYQFLATTPLGFLGLGDLWHKDRPIAVLLLFIVLGDVAFLLAATDPRTGGHYAWNLHYYLQAYVVFAVWMAVGFKIVLTRWASRDKPRQTAMALLTFGLPVLVYAAAPVLARPFAGNLPGFRPLPGRDNLTYVLSPWKFNETGARAYGENVLSSLPQDSVLLADYSLWAVVRYLHEVEGMRPDVELVQLPYAGSEKQVPLILRYRESPYVFIADVYEPYYDLAEIQEHFEIVQEGLVYRLAPK